ncbi:PH domain-containing protein [Bacillus sp. V2I10]
MQIVFGLIKREIPIRDMKEIRYSNNPLFSSRLDAEKT